jgi:tryptophan synthase alpha chain
MTPAAGARPRIETAFESLRAAGRTGLVTFVSAGDPDLPRSADVLRALDAAGADVLEVGVPFSDPLADGPVIQRASERALAAGATLERVLDLVGTTRADLRAPVVLFTYANPVVRMGLERFARRAAGAGVDGVLVLDLPIEEADGLRGALDACGLDTIFLLSPTTTRARIERAAALGRGFLYGISRLGVTGVRDQVSDGARELAGRVREVTAMPLAVGFGISRPEHVAEVGRWADAAVVGSALVRVVADHGADADLPERVAAYVRWLKGDAAIPDPGGAL